MDFTNLLLALQSPGKPRVLPDAILGKQKEK
jgi:hypothetical protein